MLNLSDREDSSKVFIAISGPEYGGGYGPMNNTFGFFGRFGQILFHFRFKHLRHVASGGTNFQRQVPWLP